ncbi:hypothetical protein QJS10_CPA01g02707 [Acorus calamus]|uniref:Pentatricopeptide repeat-containing protein-mitochondrial domain-containing protein n=1 Tax=Acorus calamus TaxID=4465 RepID=A0AAV9FJE6_ACOCL|nr:hypothetical protein QJS10_CPA01g02707 [Acorus calamus]
MIASLARRHQTPSTLSKTLTATAFPLLADPPPSPSHASPSSDLHRNLCLSLVDRLILRGDVPAARGLIDRIITRPGWTASDAVSAADHADSRGLSLDYPRLLHGLVRSGQSSKAEEFYAGVRSRASVSSDPRVLDSMILCYSALGSPDHARLHFQHLIRMGHSPSKPAYDALMRAFFAEDRHSEAADLFFESGLLPFPSSFTCLIDCLSHTGKPDEAFRVLDVMLRSGVRPIKRNFRSLAFALCKRGRIEEAEDLCRLMLGHGFYVDRVMCTSLVHGYCKAGKLDLALNVFCWMKHPDAYAYDTLLFGFVKQGYIEDAWRLLDRMVEKGLSPDAVTYHVMISWFCKNLRIDCALELLRMMDRVGVPPDVHIYTVLISALCKAGRTEEANRLFDWMLDAGLIPDHLMFVLMISKYPKGYEPVLVLKILQAIAKRVSGVDVAMSSELSDCSCDEEVLQEKIAPLLDEILKRDVPPDVGKCGSHGYALDQTI